MSSTSPLVVLVAVALLFTTLHARAAPPAMADETAIDPAEPLSLVQLTDLALRRNPQTRLAWAAIRASEAGVELARAGYWPQIDAAVTAQRNRALNFSGLPSTTQTRYGASVSLSYLLWDFGVRRGELERAEFELGAARLSQDQTLQNVILAVEQAYFQVLGLAAVIDANRQSLDDAETNLAAARDRRRAGLATLGDVYRAEAALAGARLALQQAEGQWVAARGQLATAVGVPPDTALGLAAWEMDLAPEPPQRSIDELLAAARTARPELLAAKLRERLAAASLAATRGRGLPSLSLDANAGETHVVGIGSSSQFNALIRLDVPLFAGHADRAAVRQAEAALDSARASTDDLRSQVELQVWQAYQNLLTASVSLETTAAQLRSAELAAEVSGERYNSGLDTVLDLLSAQGVLAGARVEQVQARLNWAAARAALGHAVGGLTAPAEMLETP